MRPLGARFICYKEHKYDYFIKQSVMSEKDKAMTEKNDYFIKQSIISEKEKAKTEKNKEQEGEISGAVFSME